MKNDETVLGVEIASTADKVGFDYEAHYNRAMEGDKESLVALLNFSQHTDAAASEIHRFNMMEIRHAIGDDRLIVMLKDCDKTIQAIAQSRMGLSLPG